MARRIGVRVLTFSLGFGPKLLAFRRGDTEYCISAIPLGGYVKMAGENPEDSRTGAPDEFLSKTKWQRFQVLVMGPVMNIALAVIVMAAVLYQGALVPAYEDRPAYIGIFAKDSIGREGWRRARRSRRQRRWPRGADLEPVRPDGRDESEPVGAPGNPARRPGDREDRGTGVDRSLRHGFHRRRPGRPPSGYRHRCRPAGGRGRPREGRRHRRRRGRGQRLRRSPRRAHQGPRRQAADPRYPARRSGPSDPGAAAADRRHGQDRDVAQLGGEVRQPGRLRGAQAERRAQLRDVVADLRDARRAVHARHVGEAADGAGGDRAAFRAKRHVSLAGSRSSR